MCGIMVIKESGMRQHISLLRCLVFILLWNRSGLAQSSAFEVVSIKPSPPAANMSRTAWEPDRLIASGVNLKQLVEWAYQITDAEVSGGPAWIDSKYFDLEAKADGAHTREELLRMLQPVLADRFQVKFHRETKQVPTYVLSAGSNRGELREAKGSPANIQIQGTPAVGGKAMSIQIIGQSVSMGYLTSYLTSSLGRLVIDRTSLNGSFDFKVEGELDQNDIITDKRSALSTALLDAMPKLGFKLDSKREAVDVLVIDHADEPSPN
jgi:uncharacterized protein (TIGR03435 family)